MATKENSKGRRMKTIKGRLKRGMSSKEAARNARSRSRKAEEFTARRSSGDQYDDTPEQERKIEFTERQKAQLLKMANTLYERADTVEEKQRVVEMFNSGEFQPDGSFVVTSGASATRVTSAGQVQDYWGDGWLDSRQSGPKKNKGVDISIGNGTLGMVIPEMRSETISSSSALVADDTPPPMGGGGGVGWSGRIWVGGVYYYFTPDERENKKWIRVKIGPAGYTITLESTAFVPGDFPGDEEWYDLAYTVGDIHCDRF